MSFKKKKKEEKEERTGSLKNFEEELEAEITDPEDDIPLHDSYDEEG